MKLSMKFFAIVAVLVTLNLTAFAQKGDRSITAKERAEKITKKMTEKLELDTYQTEKVRDLNLTLAAKLKALKTNDTMDRAAKKAEVKALRDEHKVALQGVLNAEQWDKFSAFVKKRKEKREERRGKNGK